MVKNLSACRAQSADEKRNTNIYHHCLMRFACCCLLLSALVSAAQTRVVVAQVGYETASSKQALIVGTAQDHPLQFSLVDYATGKTVITASLTPGTQVNHWGGRVFWTADFSAWQKAGHYEIRTETAARPVSSCTFAIEDNLLERHALSHIVYYVKGQRSSGLFLKPDLPFRGPDRQNH